jgi:EAL domain-containing protein (putative c-di-GMP-specific phosphodiesterase class I)/DNA-binding response OmpR family regulator
MQNVFKKTKNYSILVVDDEEEIRLVLKDMFQKIFKDVDIAKDGEEALSKYIKKDYDIVMTDLTMPKIDGIDLINKIKKLNPLQKIIIISAHKDKEYFLEAILNQTNGYLVKPFDFENFKKIIDKIIKQIEQEKLAENYKVNLEKELVKKTQELKEHFFKDELTKLYNINKLKEDLKNLEEEVYFVGVDISNFRKINSIFGIENGNFVLKKIAKFLQEIFPKTNVYRLQGAVFAYIFPKKGNNIYHILEILKNKLSQFKLNIDSIVTKFIFKVLAVSGREDVLTKYSIVESFVKDKGKKQIYQYFNEKIQRLQENQKERLFWVNKSVEAVYDSNIEPFFQAIVDNKTKEAIKYEALARLKDNEKYISPYFFIEPAKEAGILNLITKIIIEKAFKKIANTDINISINISSNDLEEGYLEEFLEEKLKENNLKPTQITLEILEEIDSEYSDKYLKQLISLKEKGFEIAIDDFGIGYSNFQRVYQIKPDFIKIDGIYIKEIITNENSLKITKTIVNFAKSIGAKTIAEFVENEEIYKKLLDLGVDYSQGYYFSKPILDIKAKK